MLPGLRIRPARVARAVSGVRRYAALTARHADFLTDISREARYCDGLL
jgi:hypothetical protein